MFCSLWVSSLTQLGRTNFMQSLKRKKKCSAKNLLTAKISGFNFGTLSLFDIIDLIFDLSKFVSSHKAITYPKTVRFANGTLTRMPTLVSGKAT